MSTIVSKDQNELANNIDKNRELIKRTFFKELSDEELDLFMVICKRRGLDPFNREIHAIARWDSASKKKVMSIQTSIDGFRLIAERTGKYVPGRETTFVYKKDGVSIFSATAYVKKQTMDGTWHEVCATAHFDEYVQKFADKNTGTLKIGKFWADLPHVMISKCAEALALRKAFPADLSGLYTKDEMGQADIEEDLPKSAPKQSNEKSKEKENVIDIESPDFGDMPMTQNMIDLLANLLSQVSPKDIETICDFYGLASISDMNQKQFATAHRSLVKRISELEKEKENESLQSRVS